MRLEHKTFRYKNGRGAGKTLTVGGLIEALKEYQHDMPVFATWEGVDAFVEEEKFSVKKVTKGNDEDECECLVIDVEQY
jgi:hypothetical protein